MSLKYVLVFSTLFGVVEYASRWPRDLPKPEKYTRGTYAYCQWEKQWYIKRGVVDIPKAAKYRRQLSSWEPVKESSVPPKYVMTIVVYPT